MKASVHDETGRPRDKASAASTPPSAHAQYRLVAGQESGRTAGPPKAEQKTGEAFCDRVAVGVTVWEPVLDCVPVLAPELDCVPVMERVPVRDAVMVVDCDLVPI